MGIEKGGGFSKDENTDIDEVIEGSKRYRKAELRVGEHVYLPPIISHLDSGNDWVIVAEEGDYLLVTMAKKKDRSVKIPREVVAFFQNNFGSFKDKKVGEMEIKDYLDLISSMSGALAINHFKNPTSITYVIAQMGIFCDRITELNSQGGFDEEVI